MSLRANMPPHPGHRSVIDLRWHSAMCLGMFSKSICSLRQEPPQMQRVLVPRGLRWYSRKWRRRPLWVMSSSSMLQLSHWQYARMPGMALPTGIEGVVIAWSVDWLSIVV